MKEARRSWVSSPMKATVIIIQTMLYNIARRRNNRLVSGSYYNQFNIYVELTGRELHGK